MNSRSLLKYPARSLDQYIYGREFEIRDAMKAVWPGLKFSMAGCRAANQSALDLCMKHHWDLVENLIWKFPADASEHGSAACAYTHFANSIAHLLVVGTELQRRAKTSELVLATVADASDRCSPGELLDFNPNTTFRRFRRAVSNMRKEFPGLLVFASMEVSASKFDGETIFEPHIHALISGVPKERVQHWLKEELTNRQLPHSKPVQVKVVTQKVLRTVCYITKSRAELRSHYLTEQGGKRSRDNLMTGATKAEWLMWMSDRQPSELWWASGLTNDQLRRIRESDLRGEIDELLQKHRGWHRRHQRHAVPIAHAQTAFGA